jgi:hypothetical protein
MHQGENNKYKSQMFGQTHMVSIHPVTP